VTTSLLQPSEPPRPEPNPPLTELSPVHLRELFTVSGRLPGPPASLPLRRLPIRVPQQAPFFLLSQKFQCEARGEPGEGPALSLPFSPGILFLDVQNIELRGRGTASLLGSLVSLSIFLWPPQVEIPVLGAGELINTPSPPVASALSHCVPQCYHEACFNFCLCPSAKRSAMLSYLILKAVPPIKDTIDHPYFTDEETETLRG
jgi:hypothetical protein